MRYLKLIIILLFAVTGIESSKAVAGACGSTIMTIEDMLVRLSEKPNREIVTGQNGEVLWQRDVGAAQEHLDEAKFYLKQRDEFNCNFHAIITLRRLGIGK